jgi:hypothetical protein
MKPRRVDFARPEKVRSGLKDVLLGPARLYEALRGWPSTFMVALDGVQA